MSLEEDASLLAKVELFANVAPRRLKLLALASSRVLFEPGQDLCVEGDEGYEAFILISGEADVKIKTPSGVATVARLKRNDIVGEMASRDRSTIWGSTRRMKTWPSRRCVRR